MALFDDIALFPESPSLELALEIRLRFSPLPRLKNLAIGCDKGMVLVEEGEFRGPSLNGIVIAASGGDYASFRGDGVVELNARYQLQEADGTPIMLHNRGFIWGRTADVMPRFSRIANGLSEETVDPSEYYFRTLTTFDVPSGKHEWLGRHAMIGAGARLKDGNFVRYFTVK